MTAIPFFVIALLLATAELCVIVAPREPHPTAATLAALIPLTLAFVIGMAIRRR